MTSVTKSMSSSYSDAASHVEIHKLESLDHVTSELTLMRLSKRQVTMRNQSTLAVGDVQPRGTNHSSR